MEKLCAFKSLLLPKHFCHQHIVPAVAISLQPGGKLVGLTMVTASNVLSVSKLLVVSVGDSGRGGQRITHMRVYSQLSVQQVISRCKNILMLPNSYVSSVTLFPTPTNFADSLQTFMEIKMNICHFLGGTFAHASSLKHAKNPS